MRPALPSFHRRPDCARGPRAERPGERHRTEGTEETEDTERFFRGRPRSLVEPPHFHLPSEEALQKQSPL
jgi:hypothetical protein